MEDNEIYLNKKDLGLMLHTLIAEGCDWLALCTDLSHEQIEEYRNAMLTVKDEQLRQLSKTPVADNSSSKFKVGDTIQFKGLGNKRYTIKNVCGATHYISTQGERMDMSYTNNNFDKIG